MNFQRMIALYMDDCHSRQLRPKTMQSYEQALKLFANGRQKLNGPRFSGRTQEIPKMRSQKLTPVVQWEGKLIAMNIGRIR